MKNLRFFETTDEYNGENCSLEDNTVSYVKENELTIFGNGKSYFTATYNVTSTTSVTRIFGNSFSTNQVNKMYIDDVEVTPRTIYTFSTTGEHTVKCEFCELTSCSNMFEYCTSLTSLDLSGLDTSNVSDMSNMFSYCSGLTSLDLSGLDTSKVTDMSGMFRKCSLTSLIIMGDVSKVTSYSSMFLRINTNGTLTYNCAYEDKWNEILSSNNFPSTWTKTCVTV